MRSYKFLLSLFLLILATGIGFAQSKVDEPLKYRLEQIYVFEDDKPTEYLFVLNGSVGFKSVQTLKRFIEKLPPSTIIEWRPFCDVMGDEPLRSSEKKMSDFKEFCRSRKIKFILGRAG